MSVQLVHSPLYFLHVPKTGGTSVSRWLESAGEFRSCKAGLWSALLAEDSDTLKSYDLFHGHFYSYLSAFLGIRLSTFTILRDPFKRARSHYRHILRDPRHYFHDRVRAQGSFAAFLKDPETQVLARDFQTRALTSTFDPVKLSRSPPSGQAHEFWLERYIETSPIDAEPQGLLLRAKQFLDSCFVVGLTDRLPDTIGCLTRSLGLRTTAAIELLNADPSGPDAEFSEQELSLLRELNVLDLELCAYAGRLLDRCVWHFATEGGESNCQDETDR